jgi:sortase A
MLLRGLAILLAVTGVLAVADGILTLVWQEPVSSLLAHLDQSRLAQNLKRLEGQRATPAEERALAALPTDNERIAFFAGRLRQSARDGQAVGRIRIPRIGANFVVVAGTGESALKKGPGIYAGTSVPGLRGTVGIAGHRTTYLAPFRRIDELVAGDRITLEMPYGLFSYTVLGHKIVSPNDVSVLRQAPYDQVVLTACNPLYSAAQRIVVFARLTAAAPAGPALSTILARPSPALLSAAAAAEAVVGESPGGESAAPPEIRPDAVLFGGGAAAPAARPARPRPPVARAPARAPVAPAKPSRSPASSPAAAPPVVRAPVRAAPTPVRVAPRAPARQPAAPPVRPPAAKTPPTRSPVSSPPPSRPAPSQTRVQGGPGGVVPIIGVPSG